MDIISTSEDSERVITSSRLIINISSLVVFNQGSSLYPDAPVLVLTSEITIGLDTIKNVLSSSSEAATLANSSSPVFSLTVA
jgi:hypothetical protein